MGSYGLAAKRGQDLQHGGTAQLEHGRKKDSMLTVIIERWRGHWYSSSAEVARVTKTKIVVKHSWGEERFNRQSGRACQRSPGLADMTDPYIRLTSLRALEAALRVQEQTPKVEGT